jgi:hypothetical protein
MPLRLTQKLTQFRVSEMKHLMITGGYGQPHVT